MPIDSSVDIHRAVQQFRESRWIRFLVQPRRQYGIHANNHGQHIDGRFFFLANFCIDCCKPLCLLVLIKNFKQILDAVGWDHSAVINLCAFEGTRSLTARIRFQNKRIRADAFTNYTLIKKIGQIRGGEKATCGVDEPNQVELQLSGTPRCPSLGATRTGTCICCSQDPIVAASQTFYCLSS